MANYKSNNILSIIAIFISILAFASCIIIMLCVHERLDFDEVYLLLSVLTLLVTTLVGMQIWNIFMFDSKLEQIKRDYNKRNENVKKEILDYNKISLEKTRYDAIGTVLMQLGWSFEDKGEFDDALRSYINALRAIQQGDWRENHEIGDAYNEIVNRLLYISKELPPEKWHFVNIDEKNVFIDTVMRIPNKDIMNRLLNFFYKFKVIESPSF